MNRGLASRLSVLVGVAALTAGFTGFAHAETTLEKIKRTHVMTAGNSGSYPPFEIMEGRKLIGFDVDMADEIGRRIGGVEVKFEVIDFKGMIAALTSGRVDTLITALTWTPERAEAISFSIPYYDAGIGALIRADAKIEKPDDLAGKSIAVQLGSSGEKFVRDTLGSRVKELKTYDAILLAVKDLQNGRADAVVNPIPVLRYSAKDIKGFKTTAVWDTRVVGINTRKDDVDLMKEINKHLEAMKQDGTLTKLDQKWFGAP